MPTDIPAPLDSPATDAVDGIDVVPPDDGTADVRLAPDAAVLAQYGWLLPYGCTLASVENPAQSVQPLQWQTCPDGRAGCTELVVNWAPSWVTQPLPLTPSDTPGTGTWLWLERTVYDGADELEWIATPADGPVQAAWRLPAAATGQCLVATAAFSDHRMAALLFYSAAASTLGEALLVAPLPDGGVWNATTIVAPPSFQAAGSGIQSVAVSDNSTAMELEPGNVLARIVDGGMRVAALSGNSNGILGPPSLIGSDIISAGYLISLPDGGATGAIRDFSADGGATTLASSTAGDVISAWAVDGVVAWVVGIGYQQVAVYNQYQLWTATYPAPGMPIAPRYVGPFPNNGAAGLLSPPYLAVVDTSEDVDAATPFMNWVVIISLVDGTRWTVYPRTGIFSTASSL